MVSLFQFHCSNIMLLVSKRSRRDSIRGAAIYILMYVCMCVIIVVYACTTYVMWAELDHIHFGFGKMWYGPVMCQPFFLSFETLETGANITKEASIY